MGHDFTIAELDRRLANLIQIGTVEQADYTKAIPVSRIRIGELLTGWLPMLSARAGKDRSWWPYEVGEQVLVLSISGDLVQGIVLGALYQNRYPPLSDDSNIHRTEYDDGGYMEYNRATGKYSLHSKGNIAIQADGDIDITASGSISINGTRIDLN